MNIDHDGNINFSHIAAVGVVATFSGLRRFLGFACLIGLIGAAVLWKLPVAPVVVNPNPICNRTGYTEPNERAHTPRDWHAVEVVSIVTHPTIYAREAHGTGWCRTYIDGEIYVNGFRKNHWAETPSKYGEKVQDLVPPDNSHQGLAVILGGVSLLFLVGIWLPATILAAVGRRLMKNIQEESYE